ncbi:hypothetical protein [Methylobacterium sp. A54F]
MSDIVALRGSTPQITLPITNVLHSWLEAVMSASRHSTALASIEAMRADRILKREHKLTPQLQSAFSKASEATECLVRGLRTEQGDPGRLRMAAIELLATLITHLQTAKSESDVH